MALRATVILSVLANQEHARVIFGVSSLRAPRRILRFGFSCHKYGALRVQDDYLSQLRPCLRLALGRIIPAHLLVLALLLLFLVTTAGTFPLDLLLLLLPVVLFVILCCSCYLTDELLSML